jgi:hypothetical protein
MVALRMILRDHRGHAIKCYCSAAGLLPGLSLMSSGTKRGSRRLEQPPQTQEYCLRTVEQIATTHDDNAIAEGLEEACPRFCFAGRPGEVNDECMLGTEMIGNEGPDFDVADESVVTQASRTQQLRQSIVDGMSRAVANEHFGSGSISQHAGEHAAHDRQPRQVAARELLEQTLRNSSIVSFNTARVSTAQPTMSRPLRCARYGRHDDDSRHSASTADRGPTAGRRRSYRASQ